MHECLLCKRDMKVSNNVFGNGCVRNIYSFLGLKMPKKVKLREKTLYNNIMKLTDTKITSISFIFNLTKNKTQYEKNTFKEMQFVFWQTVIEVGGKYAEFPISYFSRFLTTFFR